MLAFGTDLWRRRKVPRGQQTITCTADIGSPRLRRRCAPLCRSAYPRCAAGRYAATWASGRLIAATRRDTAITI